MYVYNWAVTKTMVICCKEDYTQLINYTQLYRDSNKQL